MSPTNPARAATARAATPSDNATGSLERPVPSGANAPGFGSDVAAEMLRALEIPYIALNPGASYRGLHDSIVNFLGNEKPQMLLCLHEEAAVAIAHGYAKVTGRSMAAAVHSNVGLMHATMAIFNAWCDRMPVIVLGATGPVDAAKRRPWIDWIHTARDQGALVRPYVKWDDQPTSPAATREALLRALWLACTPPMAPVYVNLDADLQEAPLAEPLAPIDIERFLPDAPVGISPTQLRRGAELLRGAQRPLFLIGRASRSEDAWNARVRLARCALAFFCCGIHGWPLATRRPRAGVSGSGRRSSCVAQSFAALLERRGDRFPPSARLPGLRRRRRHRRRSRHCGRCGARAA